MARFLSDVFRAHLGGAEASETTGRDEKDAELEAALRAYVDAARAAWPSFGIDDAELVRYLAARAPGAKVPPVQHAADMLLACACGRGVPSAVEAFHRSYGGVIARVLTRRRASTDMAEDAIQNVLERLLVALPGAAPKIAEYRGSGALRSWVATAAATTLLMMRRTAERRREEDDAGFLAGLARDADPEVLYMKERYKAEMEEAITGALTQLSDRERTLLRLHLGEHMSIDELGTMYRVNRATAARWLAAARESLITSARDALRTRLKLSDRECESIGVLIQSDLQLSIARRLS
jgi:RNA polymerase sigma-70 factor (ECF subfamily)